MPRAIKGVLVECDPSIKALIIKIDADNNMHDIIIEDLDDTHLLIDSSKVDKIKYELDRLLAENTYNPMDDEQEV